MFIVQLGANWMETETTPNHFDLYKSFTHYEASTLTNLANSERHLTILQDSSSSMIDPNNEPQALFTQGSLQEDYGVDKFISSLVDEHIWLIGLLTGVIIILVVLSCSLRSNYFQENYFFTRAKEWVHLPLLQQSAQDSLLTAETGAVHSEVAAIEPEQPQLSPAQHCSWVTETSPEQQRVTMKSSWAEVDHDGDQQKLTLDMSTLSMTSACTDEIESTDQPSASSPCELLRSSFKAKKNHFVFNADIFLTKSESLDEARSRSQLREKCFKANRSVDEILSRQEKPSSSSSDQQKQSTSSIPCTPKCRKLQERRGSNHSLTIAVKPEEIQNILPTVVTPREWYLDKILCVYKYINL